MLQTPIWSVTVDKVPSIVVKNGDSCRSLTISVV